MLGEMVDACAPSGCRACSVRVAIHSCVVIPHCVGISSCVSSSASRCILTHRKTHAWSENASKNSKQRREGNISFYTPPSGGRPMLPGNRQNSMVRAGFSSERKAQERV